MKTADLNQLDIACSEANNVEARLCVTLPQPAGEGWQLTGSIHGPHCAYARTLAATIPLRPTAESEVLQCAATVPDPCLWTPELPILYDVQVQLRQHGAVVAMVQRGVAIRSLNVRGRNLLLSNRRWVIRGVRRVSATGGALEEWRNAHAAMMVEHWDEVLAAEATPLGVPLIVVIDEKVPSAIASELRRCMRSPSVVMAVVDADSQLPNEYKRDFPGILLAARSPAESAAPLPRWAHLMLLEFKDARGIARAAADRPHPVIALRPLGEATDIVTARAACDRLQADLAPEVDLAGYIV